MFRKTCVTGKLICTSRADAKKVIELHADGRRMRVYLCEVCMGWHATSQEFDASIRGSKGERHGPLRGFRAGEW